MLKKLKPFLGRPYPRSEAGVEVRFNCPYCYKRGRGEDINYHLYLNRVNGFFFCQRCEAKGHISKFTNDEEPDYGRTMNGERKHRVAALKDCFRPQAPTKEPLPTISGWPDDYIPVMDFPQSQAVKYLESRGISFNAAIQRGLGFGTKFNRGRVIFPVFSPGDKSKCQYWVARSYTNGDHDDSCECYLCKYKYTNPKGVKRRYYIYGLEFCNDGDTCCVTEGPISALNSGQNGLGAFGKYITLEQLDLIADRFAKIQMALDPDAYVRAAKTMRSLIGMGKHVEWVPLPPKKDPADLGVERMEYLRKEEALPITRHRLGTVMLSGLNLS